jgi:uncharacterized protein (TIGR03083 family)
MTSFEPVAVLRREAHRMAEVPVEHLGNTVPACPDWDVGDLLAHTGWVHRAWAHVLSLPEGERTNRERSMAAGLPKPGATLRPEGDLRAWLRSGADALADLIEATPPAKRVITLFGERDPAFIARRNAHETAVHRWDAESALGTGGNDFDPALAADGVDELLDVWVPVRFDHATFGGRGETIELVPAEGGDRWSIVVGDESTTWRRGAPCVEPAVRARGPVADLYLFVWSRLPSEALEISGDAELLARWQRWTAV